MDAGLAALVVGAGSIGMRHARNLDRLGAAVAVVDADPDARSRAIETLGVDAYADLKEALATAKPDVAVVCTPNSTHVEVATTAARRGCDLFVEKPLSHAMDGVADLEARIVDRDLVTLVGCNLRFLPELQKVKQLLEDDAIGPVRAVRIQGGSYLPEWFPEKDYRDAYSARSDLGGGVILDYIHEINYARWLFGEFETVSAMTGQHSNLEIDTNDVAGILARTANDLVCQFHLDYVQRPTSRSCHVVGEAGTICWSWSEERVRWFDVDAEAWRSYERPDGWELNDMYFDEMDHFLDSVIGRSPTICPMSCGRRDIEVALAARESAASGRHVSL